MAKQLTPLETLKQVRTFRLSYRNGDWLDKEEQDKLFDIIETALKENQERIEELEETNHLMFLREHKNERKLKALEIIKEKQLDMYQIMDIIEIPSKFAIEIYNKDKDIMFQITIEEFDLLKEALK